MTLHPLLVRQLARAGVDMRSAPAELRAVFERVSVTYANTDQDRYRLERSIAISSEEMSELASSLANERDRIRAIFDSAAVGITQATLDGTLIECNEAYAEMVGLPRSQIIGRQWLEFVHPDERDSVWSKTSSELQGPITFERRYVHANGSVIWASVTVSTVRDSARRPLCNIAVQRDVTERRTLEASLRQAQKLEAVGRLAAGVAHEINTPLQFVGDNLTYLEDAMGSLTRLYEHARASVDPAKLANLQALEEEEEPAHLLEEAPRALAQAIDGVRRVARIVRAMKVLVHNQSTVASAERVDVNAVLESVLMLSQAETKYVADVVTDLGDVPPVLGFADDLSRVFLNLIINAAHAVADGAKSKPKRTRGTINVRTTAAVDHVLITIEDSGCGIPSEARTHIFEPFFTTKEPGRGAGQGLAVARAIVHKHDGALTFDSEADHGTRFYVRLPIAPSQRIALDHTNQREAHSDTR